MGVPRRAAEDADPARREIQAAPGAGRRRQTAAGVEDSRSHRGERGGRGGRAEKSFKEKFPLRASAPSAVKSYSFYLGSPRMRCAMTLRWISLVPPMMVSEREYMKSRAS